MRNIFLASIFLFLILSCSTSKKTYERTKEDREYIESLIERIDSISKVNSTKNDTIIEKEIVYIEKEVDISGELDCDSLYYNQTIVSGNTTLELIKENGRLYFRMKKDSSELSRYKELYKSSTHKIDSLITIIKEKNKEEVVKESFEKETSKEVVIKETFWMKIQRYFWVLLSLLFFILWLLGITPKYLLNKYIKLK